MIKECKQIFFKPGEVKPGGWLKDQLRLQAEGLSGNLDKVWPDIRDSKWIGGNRDGWERMPYWLDGFIPLAWLLDDEDLKTRASGYINVILKKQEEDGWICPCTQEERREYDLWVAFLICKVLVVYHDCTGDERIEEAVYKTLKSLYGHLEKRTVFDWAAARWFECLISIFWIYERRPEEWMLDLARTLKIEGFDYQALYSQWAFQKPENRWNFKSHVVNLAMSLKAEALYSRMADGVDPEAMALLAHELLMRDHGMAVGHFTGDECLSGNSPIQGSELCSVVEAMYSYEWLLSITGNSFWADKLEVLAYNALPAALSPDMWTHQYDQMSNQPQCSILPEDKVHFRTNNGEAHLFGLEPHFGCCTANFSQGWPKFALSVFARTANGISIGAIAPGRLDTEMNGVRVSCEIITEYPFRDNFRIKISSDKAVKFPLSIRIPGFAMGGEVDKRAFSETEISKGFVTIDREWSGETTIQVDLKFEPEFVQRSGGLYCVKRGPLVYALPVKEEWVKREYEKDGVKREFPYCDYEVFPKAPWAFAFADKELKLEEGTLTKQPFNAEQVPVSLVAGMYPIEWQSENGICALLPGSAEPTGEREEIALVPYGCTNLRMTEMPMAEIPLAKKLR